MDQRYRALLAMIAEQERMEARVWSRNPDDSGAAELLPYLMTRCERSRWEMLRIEIDALRRRI